MRFWRRNTSKYERYKGRKSPDCLAITVSRRTVESCLYRQVDGVLSKQMPSQDGQGRKLPHIVSIVANVLITEVEGHYRIAINGSFFNTQRMLQQYVVKAYFL
jgi:hypothetical protein